MRDSVPSGSYSSVCNVLRQWNIPLIPTYRVYRLYDIYRKIRAIEQTRKLASLAIIIYRTYGLLVPGGAPVNALRANVWPAA